MRLYLGILALLFLAALPVRADDHVQCVGDRSQCSPQILAACPEGALIVSEHEYPAVNAAGESSTGYELTIRCPGHTSDAAAAPVVPAVPTLQPKHDVREVRAARLRLQKEYDRVPVVDAGIVTGLSLAAAGALVVFAAVRIPRDEGMHLMAPLVVGGLATAGFTIGSLVWFTKSLRQRHEIRDQLRELDGLGVSFARSSQSTSAMLSYQTRF